jgi:hypothetical protein
MKLLYQRNDCLLCYSKTLCISATVSSTSQVTLSTQYKDKDKDTKTLLRSYLIEKLSNIHRNILLDV